ncbi:LysM peptidoglycan-binding domain-containing protein [Paenibacillus tarimensis]|uniref:LysM peptidoglycan-binding domain-containing protein n=1 Tax=Paenibacillus tarimensis TaxID=416012 RepID=UPI001F45DF2E|nr:LysM peptidoglycan-binding domain-containing protein [Paenibacillus tarimensis]MCF2944905.1 LysM peptidoglycan-binding domain-containing protein [Paenibacillus tarimensis]
MNISNEGQMKLLQLEDGSYCLDILITAYNMELAEEPGEGRHSSPANAGSVIDKARQLLLRHYPNYSVSRIRIFSGGIAILAASLFGSGEHTAASSLPSSTSQTIVASAAAPAVYLNGKQLDAQAVIMNNSVYVPIRIISESLQAAVDWNPVTRTVVIRRDTDTITIQIGTPAAVVNGQTISTPSAFLYQGTAMVPLRFVGEALGLEVSWDSAGRRAILQTRTDLLSASSPFHIVGEGESLWKLSQLYNTSIAALRQANHLADDLIRPGQQLVIPRDYHTVSSGESLWMIARNYGVSVNALTMANRITSDSGTISPGEQLVIPAVPKTITPAAVQASPTPQALPPAPSAGITVTYRNHTVQAGDNLWNISQQYGMPFLDLLKLNGMTDNTVLRVGQTVRVAVYDVPVKQAVSPRHGEVLDWWTEARYVFPTGKTATITDFRTGRSFQVKHTMGGNHADSEPLTARDAQVMKEIWGGSYSWTPRAIIIEVDGRRLAAAMHSFPHGDATIKDNNYNGHFCIHFLNSQRHSDGMIQDSMQKQVAIAAGRSLG